MIFSQLTLDILINTTFVISMFMVFRLQSEPLEIRQDAGTFGPFIITLFASLMLGLYDIGYGVSGDRELYAANFLSHVNYDISWEEVLAADEWVFQSWMHFMSFLGDSQYWLICTALIYAFNYYVVAKRVAPKHVFLMLVTMFTSFGFVTYGTNTIRAGFALSFVLIAMTYYEKMAVSLLILFLAYNIHHSTAIPMGAFLLARYWNRPKFFYYFWFFCVVLSAVAGSYFTTLFSSLGQDFDNRVDYLTTTDTHYNVGFRLDFVLFSCLPIIVGYLYQQRYEYKDQFYSILHSTYIIANAFWVLVIRANFSDRFAYLSWFLYALVMMYPLLDQPDQFPNVGKKAALTLFIISGFTYYMYLK